MSWYVEIVAYDGDEVVKRMGPMNARNADRVEGGASMNLNHEEYFVRQVEEVKERG